MGNFAPKHGPRKTYTKNKKPVTYFVWVTGFLFFVYELKDYTENRIFKISPSWTTYSLPST